MGESISDIGEFGFIESLRRRLGGGSGVELGPGDDAAAVTTGSLTLASADLLVEGVHFDFGLSSAADVGYKALAVNVSDIAAVGGRALYALVSIGAPAATPVATLDAIYDGLTEAGEGYGVSIVGGDTVSAPQLIVSVAVLGSPGEAGVVRRSGARPGDLLCVTGALGAAAAGLALLRASGDDRQAERLGAAYPELLRAHRRPLARASEGLAAAAAGATAMIDVSDGLASDGGHIARSSGVGLEIRAESVPLARGVREVAELLGRDPLELALGGGEDYELAIAIPATRVPPLASALAPTPLTPVGELVGDELVVVVEGGRIPLEGLGFEHFAPRRGGPPPS
jgi:thiamine-monophosphate kinase